MGYDGWKTSDRHCKKNDGNKKSGSPLLSTLEKNLRHWKKQTLESVLWTFLKLKSPICTIFAGVGHLNMHVAWYLKRFGLESLSFICSWNWNLVPVSSRILLSIVFYPTHMFNWTYSINLSGWTNYAVLVFTSYAWDATEVAVNTGLHREVSWQIWKICFFLTANDLFNQGCMVCLDLYWVQHSGHVGCFHFHCLTTRLHIPFSPHDILPWFITSLTY